MIKGIVFDLDGVYFTPESFKKFKAVLVGKYGANAEKVEEALHKSKEIELFKAGKLSETEFWSYFNELTGSIATIEDVYNTFQDVYEVNKEVKSSVLNAKNNGYRTCVISNNFLTRTKSLQDKFNFESDFDTVVYSYQVGILKPAKEIYQALIDKSGLEPNEIIYSDDNEDKLQGAKDLKIECFVYKDFDQFMSTLNNYGVTI